MLKIVILTHHFYPDVGGIETNSEILAAAFHNSGAEVHVITWTKNGGAKQFPFPVIRNPNLSQLFKEHQWADVLLENNPCLRLSWPNIFISTPLVIAVNTWVNRIKGNKGIRDKLKQVWFGRAANVIAVSNAVRKKEWPQAVVIENPFNNHLFKLLPGIKKTIPFVFLGRLVSDKGVSQAIFALSVLINEKLLNANSVQLTIIGDGPEKENLLLLVNKLKLGNAVHLTGILKGNELVNCLNEHQYILVPSAWEEPYGNVVLEGMACGCIPVTSDGGGLPEAVGKAGLTFKRNDLGDMINVLKNLLTNPQQRAVLITEAYTHLVKHSVECVSNKYYNVLNKAVIKK